MTVSCQPSLHPQRRNPGTKVPGFRAPFDPHARVRSDSDGDELVADESALAKWTYQLPNWSLESLLKKRSELLEAKKEEAAAGKAESRDGTEPAPTPVGIDQ